MKEEKMDEEKTAEENIENFKNNGISVLEKLDENALAEMVRISNAAYYNSNNSLLSDNEFDILKEYIEKKYPKNESIASKSKPPYKEKTKYLFPMKWPLWIK
jgi:endonuclease III-like uncharacterized protein